ncbi:hypothetical protein SKAU_G00212720 [Synaphobranchus kaupii]|uniref:Uncharacterized protein n=1 Tax=Synaphobranchus kaupii TaxID=118154 RepID=A0A9Q1F9D9_SYNKA|nr:hypothetical protein SKAU_G00212720 [Synaphobranchus kaupii]
MRCVSGERRRLVCPLPDPDTSGAPHPATPEGGPAIPGQPEIRGARASCTAPVKLPTCHCPRSGSRPGRAGRLTPEARARFRGSPPRLTGQLLGRRPRRRAEGPRETAVPARAAAGVIREKGPARVQSRRRRPTTTPARRPAFDAGGERKGEKSRGTAARSPLTPGEGERGGRRRARSSRPCRAPRPTLPAAAGNGGRGAAPRPAAARAQPPLRTPSPTRPSP